MVTIMAVTGIRVASLRTSSKTVLQGQFPPATSPGHHSDASLYFFVTSACGQVHQDTDLIAAMDQTRYESSNLCGKQVKIVSGSNSVVVTVADECPSCENSNSIDLSKAAFEALAGHPGDPTFLRIGELPIEWQFMS